MNHTNNKYYLNNKLIESAERGNARELLNCLNKGAHINARDADGSTAWCYALVKQIMLKILNERNLNRMISHGKCA